MRSIRTPYVAVAIALVGFLAAPNSLCAQTKKIVFVAGPKDHGAPGRHEYEKDLRTLAYSLEHASNLKGVVTKVYVGQVPRDLNEIKDAAVIVLESSAEKITRETHALFANNTTTDGMSYGPDETAFLKGFDELLQKGMGLVVFHYSTQVGNATGKELLQNWLGGGWKDRFSTNPVDDWAMAPAPGAEKHPILQGVKPWNYHEEVFCKFFFPPETQTTPLLVGTPAKSSIGAQVASWAYERKGGGRSLVMGGLDWHSNMQIEDNRRFLLNAIVWAAGMQVPAGGVQSAIPADM
jgi:hypothetical protein